MRAKRKGVGGKEFLPARHGLVILFPPKAGCFADKSRNQTSFSCPAAFFRVAAMPRHAAVISNL